VTRKEVIEVILWKVGGIGPHKGKLRAFVDLWYDHGGVMLSGPEAEEHEILETVKMICLN